MSARRKYAGISRSVTKRGTKRTVAGAALGEALERRDVHPRHPDDPELGALDLAKRLEQNVDSLVGADQAEAEDHRALDLRELSRQRQLVGLVG